MTTNCLWPFAIHDVNHNVGLVAQCFYLGEPKATIALRIAGKLDVAGVDLSRTVGVVGQGEQLVMGVMSLESPGMSHRPNLR